MIYDDFVKNITDARMRQVKAEIQAEQDVFFALADAMKQNGVKIKQSYDVRTWNGHIFSQIDYFILNTKIYFTHLMDTSRTLSGRKEHHFLYNFDSRLRRLIQVRKTADNIAIFNIVNHERIQKLLDLANQYNLER